MEKGFILIGTIVASDIKRGVRKDDGVPYARRISVISTGTGVVSYGESVDPATIDGGNTKPLPLMKDVKVYNISYTNTNGGMISVNGDHELIK